MAQLAHLDPQVIMDLPAVLERLDLLVPSAHLAQQALLEA